MFGKWVLAALLWRFDASSTDDKVSKPTCDAYYLDAKCGKGEISHPGAVTCHDRDCSHSDCCEAKRCMDQELCFGGWSPKPDDNGYAWSIKGTSRCIGDYAVVTDVSQCKAAAEYLNVAFETAIDNPDFPHGCFRCTKQDVDCNELMRSVVANEVVYWNTALGIDSGPSENLKQHGVDLPCAANPRACKASGCDKETCCEQVTCGDHFAGVCGMGQIPADRSKQCSSSTCTTFDCCKPIHCKDMQEICKGGWRKNNSAGDCKPEGCDPPTCCEQETCGNDFAVGCHPGEHLLATKACPAGGCTPESCCKSKVCEFDFTCKGDWVPKGANTSCPITGCSDSGCCFQRNCGVDFKRDCDKGEARADPRTTCPGGICQSKDCCKPLLCEETFACTVIGWLRKDQGSLCPSSGCTLPACCRRATCGADFHGDCGAWGTRKSESVLCPTGQCDEATCCDYGICNGTSWEWITKTECSTDSAQAVNFNAWKFPGATHQVNVATQACSYLNRKDCFAVQDTNCDGQDLRMCVPKKENDPENIVLKPSTKACVCYRHANKTCGYHYNGVCEAGERVDFYKPCGPGGCSQSACCVPLLCQDNFQGYLLKTASQCVCQGELFKASSTDTITCAAGYKKITSVETCVKAAQHLQIPISDTNGDGVKVDMSNDRAMQGWLMARKIPVGSSLGIGRPYGCYADYSNRVVNGTLKKIVTVWLNLNYQQSGSHTDSAPLCRRDCDCPESCGVGFKLTVTETSCAKDGCDASTCCEPLTCGHDWSGTCGAFDTPKPPMTPCPSGMCSRSVCCIEKPAPCVCQTACADGLAVDFENSVADGDYKTAGAACAALSRKECFGILDPVGTGIGLKRCVPKNENDPRSVLLEKSNHSCVCNYKPEAKTCGNHYLGACPVGDQVQTDVVCPGTGCDELTCCKNTKFRMCDSFRECPTGFKLRRFPTVCSKTGCDAGTCCKRLTCRSDFNGTCGGWDTLVSSALCTGLCTEKDCCLQGSQPPTERPLIVTTEPPPRCTCPDIFIGGDVAHADRAGCPTGFEHVTKVETCAKAAKYLHIQPTDATSDGGDHAITVGDTAAMTTWLHKRVIDATNPLGAHKPFGCFSEQGNRVIKGDMKRVTTLWVNLNQAVSGHYDSGSPICKKICNCRTNIVGQLNALGTAKEMQQQHEENTKAVEQHIPGFITNTFGVLLLALVVLIVRGRLSKRQQSPDLQRAAPYLRDSEDPEGSDVELISAGQRSSLFADDTCARELYQ